MSIKLHNLERTLNPQVSIGSFENTENTRLQEISTTNA